MGLRTTIPSEQQRKDNPAWWHDRAGAEGTLRRTPIDVPGLVKALKLDGFRARQVGTSVLGARIVVPLDGPGGQATAIKTLCVTAEEFAIDAIDWDEPGLAAEFGGVIPPEFREGL